MPLMSVTIQPVLAEVDALAPRLTAAAQPYLTQDRLVAFEIAVVEALSNVIRHAGLRPDQPVGVNMQGSANGMEVTITDDGPPPPGDLFTRPQPDDPMAESGRGIGLILMCANGVEARRENGRNSLTLRFAAG